MYNYAKQVDIGRLSKEIRDSEIVTALDYMNCGNAENIWATEIYFKAALSPEDEAILDSLVAAHVATPLPEDVIQQVQVVSSVPVPPGPTSAANVPIVELALRRGDPGFINFTIVSHDLSDRTTWYQKSVQVMDETLTDSGDGKTFSSAHPHWINMKSPKLTVDYKKVLERDGSLSSASSRYVVVKVDGDTKTESTAFAQNDYSVNYATGEVTFAQAQTGTVTASYWHNDGVQQCSEFLFTPPPGYCYRISHVESQFSKNSVFTDHIQLEIWAGAVTGGNTVNLAGYGGFSQMNFDLGYGQSRSLYRNMKDCINWCTNAYPTIPACGEIANDVLCFPFMYLIHPIVSSKQGTVIRLLTTNDTEITAEICTITFYTEKGPA